MSRSGSARKLPFVAPCILGVFLAAVVCSGPALANPIQANLQYVGAPACTPIRPHTTFQNVDTAGGIVVWDKLFDLFTVTTATRGGGVAPEATDIKVTGVEVNGNYGLRFNALWSAGGGQLADSTIQFYASVLPAYVAQGYVFEDNTLWLSAYGNTTSQGQIAITENLSAQLAGPSFSDKEVWYTSPTDNQVSVASQFAPITAMWVVKDVARTAARPLAAWPKSASSIRPSAKSPSRPRSCCWASAGWGWSGICGGSGGGEESENRWRFRPRRNDIAVDVDGRLGFPGCAVCVAGRDADGTRRVPATLTRANPAGSPVAAGLRRRHAI